jgi:hypothetical protein
MICKICGYNERDDTDGICDDCKVFKWLLMKELLQHFKKCIYL